MTSNLDRIKCIETTTLTSVSLRGSHKIVSHDDFRFLIDQAKEKEDWQQKAKDMGIELI